MASRKREERKEKYVTLAYDLLRRLIDEAEPRGLKLGVENRASAMRTALAVLERSADA